LSTYDSTTYGDHWASLYDLIESPSLDTEGAVECLSELSGNGTLLELGVGTGRVALPLVERGFTVHGIEASSAMIEELQKRPGAEELTIIKGDFADIAATTSYSLIFAAYNTFSSLLEQETQIQCLKSAARSLTPSGALVLELAVPDLARLAKEQDVSVRFVDSELVVLHAAQYDLLNQKIVGQTTVTTNGLTRIFPVQVRYIWPSELDLMARIAGLKLESRWADWQKSEFKGSSTSHISVYRLLD
tara:strand:+ start:24614 stop:25351 length:738 start_codon:yes stop_codon:yes gene_type:complete